MNPALLTLVQWLSPAFPTGGFAYSHGLEWAMAKGDVRDAAGLTAWLRDILHKGSGRSDAILLALALRGEPLAPLCDMARAMAASGERLREMNEQGAAFARTVSALTGRDFAARPLPLAVGAAALPLGLDPQQVIALYLQGFVANLVAAAVRFVPLGQTSGQAVIAALQGDITRISADATTATVDQIGTCALGADIAAMAHETMDVRIFKT